MKRVFSIILLLLAFCSLRANSQLAAQADSAYNQENFIAAVRLYHQAINADGVSPQLYYNLGNAYYRLGKLGRAVLNYERALKLDPSMQDARANLAFVNTKILDKPEDDSSFLGNLHQSIMALMSPNAWAWTAFGLFVLALGCVALYIFTTKVGLRKTGFFGGFVVIAIFIYVLTIAAQTSSVVYDHNYAVVIVPTSNLSTSPGNTTGKNAKIIPVHEGTVLEITDSLVVPGESSSPMWYDVKINNSTRAWARSVDVERI